MVISTILTAVFLALALIFVKNQEKKNLILKASAVITIIIHYSNVWVEFFANAGDITVESNHILPMYPCNVVMWLLLITAFIKHKDSLIFKLLSSGCFYVGIVCAVVGILLNANFDANPTLSNYYVLKGLLSHSTMLFGCLYLGLGRFFKVGVLNALGSAFVLFFFVLCGMIVNGLYDAFGMVSPDGMMLKGNPYFSLPVPVLAIFAIMVMFIALALYELRLPKEERWYVILCRKVDNIKEKIQKNKN